MVVAVAIGELGKALGFTLEQIDRLCRAAIVHDWRKRLDKAPQDFTDAERNLVEEEYKKLDNDKFLDPVMAPEQLEREFIKDEATFAERLLLYVDSLCHNSDIVPFAERLDKAAASPNWKWLADNIGWKEKVRPILGESANYFDAQKIQESRIQQIIFERLRERGWWIEISDDVPSFIKSLIEKNYKV